MRSVLVSHVVGVAALVGCANDPLYLQGEMAIEAGIDMMGVRSEARASLQLPIKTETASDLMKRSALEAELGVMVPYVKVGDLEVEVEWTIRNLDTSAGKALIQLNGATEFWVYDPTAIVLNPDDEDAPPTPGLDGDVPIDVPEGGEVSGLFTEDDLREASIDADQVTRGHVNPFRASLTISKNAQEFQPLTTPDPTNPDDMQTPVGPPIPRAAFAQLIRIDLVFKPSRHMVLEYTVRVRDIRGIMHDLLLTAVTDKPDELQPFAPDTYAPGGTTPPPVP